VPATASDDPDEGDTMAGHQRGELRRARPVGGDRAAAPRIPTAARRLALGVAAGRYALAFAAIPLIPWLLREHVAWLILLQPRREWLLLGGAQTQVQGTPAWWVLLAAYAPLMILGVWAFFVVGRAYQRTLRLGAGPRWVRRALPPAQIELWQGLLVRRGPTIAIFGRLAAVPPTLLAAAAGVSDVSARRYLGADLLGAALTFGVVLGAGYGLGTAYERAGSWLTGLGVVLLVVMAVLAARWIRREAARSQEHIPPRPPTPAAGGQ
jgi:membrane protein DedA with SNARE-associated domain